MPGQADPVADVCQIAAAQYRDRALRRQVLQGLGRAVDERGRIGIRDDLGQRAVEVETHERLSAIDDADQLAIGVQRVRQLRHAFVTGAHRDIGEVGNHHVGAAAQEFLGMAGAVDADDEREPAVATGLAPRPRRPRRPRTAPEPRPACWWPPAARRVGLARQPESLGDHAVDADGEQVAESGRLEDVLAVAARRVNGRRNPGFGQLAHQSDRRLEYRHAGVQPLEEDLLLAVAEPAHRVIGAVGRVSRWQRNPARRKEIGHAVIAGLAVHEVPVVVVGERRVVLIDRLAGRRARKSSNIAAHAAA